MRWVFQASRAPEMEHRSPGGGVQQRLWALVPCRNRPRSSPPSGALPPQQPRPRPCPERRPVSRTPCPVPGTPSPVPRARYPVPGTPYPVPRTPCPVPRTRYPMPGTPCPVPCAQYSVPRAQYPGQAGEDAVGTERDGSPHLRPGALQGCSGWLSPGGAGAARCRSQGQSKLARGRDFNHYFPRHPPATQE